MDDASSKEGVIGGGTPAPDCSTKSAGHREQKCEAFAVLVREGRDEDAGSSRGAKRIASEKRDIRV